MDSANAGRRTGRERRWQGVAMACLLVLGVAVVAPDRPADASTIGVVGGEVEVVGPGAPDVIGRRRGTGRPAGPPLATQVVLELTVVNNADSGPGSLRAAIATASSATEPVVVTFDPGLAISLTSGPVVYLGDQDLSLVGNASSVDGGFDQILLVNETDPVVTIADLTFSNGVSAGVGGAIRSPAELVLEGLTFTDNQAVIGGAVYATGPTTIIDSTFTSNSAEDRGGAVAFRGANVSTTVGPDETLEVDGSTFTSNEAGTGGAIAVQATTEVIIPFGPTAGPLAVPVLAQPAPEPHQILDVTGSTFTDNQAENVTGGAIDLESTVAVDDYEIAATITSSSFVGNAAVDDDGGAIHHDGQDTGAGGVTIVGSLFEDNTGDSGGAVRATDGTVAIADSAFIDNAATEFVGGAVYATGPVDVDASSFLTNEAATNGGAIYAEAPDFPDPVAATVTGSSFDGNELVGSTTFGPGDGGAIRVEGTADVSDSTFANGLAAHGGALYAWDVVVATSSFIANEALFIGGAIHIAGSDALVDGQVTASDFTGNIAEDEGGAIYSLDAVEVVETGFSSNQAGLAGGAIHVECCATDPPAAGVLVLTDSDFDDNEAGSGGAVRVLDGVVSVTGGMFADNLATVGRGGAVHVTGAADVDGTLFDGNVGVTDGGAVAVDVSIDHDPDVATSDATFTGNQVVGAPAAPPGRGGAVWAAGRADVATTTFTGGSADRGGAISARGATIADSGFAGNGSTTRGGAVELTGLGEDMPAGIVTGSTFTGNTTDGPGGALATFDALSVAGSAFTDNVAGGSGGGIACACDDVDAPIALLVAATTFTTNEGNDGGAIQVAADTEPIVVTTSTFTTNTTTQAPGGAIQAIGPLEVTATTFAGNISADDGGAINLVDAPPDSIGTIETSTFVANEAAQDGGAVATQHVISATNSTFTGNDAAQVGGAFATTDADLFLTHVTVAANGGRSQVDVEEDFTSTATVVALADGGQDCRVFGTTISSFSHDTDGTCDYVGPGDVSAGPDPLLGPLGANGGPTATMVPVGTSSLVDAVPTSDCLVGVPEDQRGVERPQAGGCDVGAVEVVVTSVPGDLTCLPDPRTFGAVAVGDSASGPVTCTATDGVVTITALAVDPGSTHPDDFSTQPGTCVGAVLAPDTSCTFGATFTPTTTGLRLAAVAITRAVGPDVTVGLRGRGTGSPGFAAAPDPTVFDDQQLGTTSPARTVTVTSTGNLDLVIGAVGVVGPAAGQFTVVASTCTNAVLAPGDTCTVDVTFRPTGGPIAFRTAQLRFADNAPGNPHDVLLRGRPLAPTLELDPDEGPISTVVEATGALFEPGVAVFLRIDDVAVEVVLASEVVGGAFTTTFVVPAGIPGGERTVTACQRCPTPLVVDATAPFTVTPRLFIEPDIGPPGFVAVAEGDGWPAGTTVALDWEPGVGTVLAEPDDAGEFRRGVLVFHRDRLGERELTGNIAGETDPAATAEFLVVSGNGQPGDFRQRR